MRVLFVVNWYTSIVEEVLRSGVFHYEQCMALQKHCDVRLYWPFEENVDNLYSKIENGLFTYRSGLKNKKNKVLWFFSTLKHLNYICNEYRPDIIHANVAYPAGLVSLIVAKKRNIPVLLTEHAPMEQMHLSNPIRKIMRKWVYKNTVRNICVSKDSMNRLKEVFRNIDFEINYNAVIDPRSVDFDQNTYRYDGYINCVIVAAFYDKLIKGYQYLIPAIKEVADRGMKIKLHICGGGEYEQYYKEYAKQIGIDEHCIFYGQCNREKVYSIINQMDFCVSSSIFECSGVSVQEEMLLGKPILVTRSGGANSLTTEYTSIVVDRHSTEALVNGLIDMADKFRNFNADEIREYAYYNFEISNVTKRYMEIYDDIMQKGE